MANKEAPKKMLTGLQIHNSTTTGADRFSLRRLCTAEGLNTRVRIHGHPKIDIVRTSK